MFVLWHWQVFSRQHGKKKYIEPNQDEETTDYETFAHDTPTAYHVYTATHQQRTMCTYKTES